MSSRNLALSALFVAFLFTGCASAPNQEQISNADYGRAMSPDECKSIAEQSISSSLKDPASAQFRNEQACERGWLSSVPLLGMKAAFGYIQRGQVNGKNSYGGYVGFRPFVVLMNNGVVVRSCVTDQDGLCMPSGS